MISGRSASPLADPPPSTPIAMLAARFLLELAGLAGLGYLGWWLGDGGAAGWTLAIGCALIGAVIWGVFRVRYDPPDKSEQPVVVPGWVRFVIEIGFFAFAAFGLWMGANRAASETLMTAMLILYVVTWDRQRWLLRQ